MVDLRRRGAAELANSQRFGGEALARSLVPALDAMDSLEAASSGDDTEGARLTRAALLDALRQHKIERIAPELGDKFEVDTMEAMLTVPVAETDRVGTVATLMRPGYVMHGERVLRAAQVGVGMAASGQGDEA